MQAVQQEQAEEQASYGRREHGHRFEGFGSKCGGRWVSATGLASKSNINYAWAACSPRCKGAVPAWSARGARQLPPRSLGAIDRAP